MQNRHQAAFHWLAFVGASLMLVMGPTKATAEESDLEQKIFDALFAKQTRAAARTSEEVQKTREEDDFICSLLKRDTRRIEIDERGKVSTIAKSRPKYEFVVPFEYNSSEISPAAVSPLVALGRALSRDELAGGRFLLGGHTDGRGSNKYNLGLSERRAETVRQFLIKDFKLADRQLLAIGFGEEELKNKADPAADENRRVQVVNFDNDCPVAAK